ncbi:hypothetical protein SAMN04488062_102159 [Flavobacterium omnivorum]|jgi:hypothetical protein|uniref:Uncharacterized protein n=1 Tax=Flavobacterium omnivorum TaxID=178355 RepID=A0A1G7X3Z1_9FLAO|nr:hypothetical protein [Flavobacterium omnivorum]SDG78919.1 hypothetical protein SAMN04488062_102159 [Flavobacterium omnivorum]
MKNIAQEGENFKPFAERTNKTFLYIGTFVLVVITVSIGVLIFLLLSNILEKSFQII